MNVDETTTYTDGDRTRKLTIWQQNLNRSAIAQQHLLHEASDRFDILALQEPHVDYFGNTRSLHKYITVTPPGHRENPTKTRSIILVNSRLLPNSWTTIKIPHPDVTAVEIMGTFGTLRIVNTYVVTKCSNGVYQRRTWGTAMRTEVRGAKLNSNRNSSGDLVPMTSQIY